MDATNRLDPASKNLNLQVGNIPSNSQSYFVDTSLLEEVRVYDSFVPAEYGRFTGGVVDARLRRYSGENHLSLDYRWNTSKMTQQKVAEGEEASWAQGKPGYAPEWKSASTPAWRIWLSTKVRRGPGGIASPIRHHALEHGRGRQEPAAARPGQLSRPNRQFPGQVQRARQRADHGRPGAQIQRPQGNTGQQPLPRNPLGQQPCGARHQRQHRPPVPGRALFAAGRLGPRAQQPRIGRRRAGHFPAPGPAAIYGGRLRQGTEAAGQLDPQRPRRPGSGAHRRNHAHPLRRPGMAAGAGRVRTLPAIAFLPSRLRQQGRLPGLQQGPLPARHRGRELRQRQRVSVRPHRMGTAGPGRRRAL